MPVIIGNRNRIFLTPEDKKYIQENLHEKTNSELAAALGLKLTRFRYFLSEMGLKRIEMEYFTREQIKFLKKSYKTIGDVELSEIFEAQWPKNKPWTKNHIRKKRAYLNLHRTSEEIDKIKNRNVKAGRHSTSIKSWETIGATEVGTIKVWKKYDGISDLVVIKLETGFVHYYRWLYIQHFGSLTSDQIVRRKKDVLKTDILKIEDLEIITRAENSARNVEIRMAMPPELREVIKEVNKLKKTIKAIENESSNDKQV